MGGVFGTKPKYLRDLILQHKTFRTRRERLTWRISREEVYEVYPGADDCRH